MMMIHNPHLSRIFSIHEFNDPGNGYKAEFQKSATINQKIIETDIIGMIMGHSLSFLWKRNKFRV